MEWAGTRPGTGAGGGAGAGPAPEKMELGGEPSGWLPRLSALLDEQCGLCEGLEALSVRQSETIAAGETDALLRILGERQVLIDRVSVVNVMLEPFRARKQEVLARLSVEDRKRLTERVGRISTLVEGVQARDENDRRLLETQRAGVADQIGSVARGRGAIAAYGNAGPEPKAQYQDRRG